MDHGILPLFPYHKGNQGGQINTVLYTVFILFPFSNLQILKKEDPVAVDLVVNSAITERI